MTGPRTSALRLRVIATLGRRHVAGPSIEDAVRVAAQEAAIGGAVTLGPWSAKGQDPEVVLAGHREAVKAIAATGLSASLSIKLPELGPDDHLADLLAWAAQHDVSIHLDSLRCDTAQMTLDRLADIVFDHPDIGCTLPGRWSRSLQDAEDVVGMGVRSVRVVKGQWPDPDDPTRDPARGMLEIIHALRGSAAQVGVATHDEGVAIRGLEQLAASGTLGRLEQLYGMPRLDVAHFRRRFGVGHLLYVPYGEAYLPYALTQAWRHPRILAWAALDLAGAAPSTRRTIPPATVSAGRAGPPPSRGARSAGRRPGRVVLRGS